MSIGATPIEFNYNTGLNRIIGHVPDEDIKNGVGKTVIILDALIFALFGKSIRNLNLNEMINSINEKECEVKLFFNVNDIPYRIERGLAPNYLKLINEIDETLNVDDNENKKEKKKKQTQQDINNVIKISYTSFINIITLNIDYSKPFFKLDPSEKRKIIEDCTNVSIYGIMYEKIKKKYNEYKNDKNIIESELKYSKENYNDKLNTFNKLETLRTSFESEKQKEILSITSQINENNEKLILLKNKIPSENYDDIKNKILDKKSSIKTKQIETTLQIQQLKKEKCNKEIEINDLKNKPICPRCKTPNTSDHTQQHIQKLISDIANIDLEISKMDTSLINISNSLTELNLKEEKLTKIINNISQLKLNIKNVEYDLSSLNNKLIETNNKQFNITQIITQQDINDSEQKYKIKEQEYVDINKKLDYAAYMKEMLGDSGVKTYIIKKIVPLLNKKMNEYLSLFKTNYCITFDNELNETLKSRKRDKFSYNNFSSGEHKRIDLAMMFSILAITKIQNSIDCNILILDEVLDSSLCDTGISQLLDFLKNEFRKEHPNLCTYIISHKKEIENQHFDTIINLKKENNFTKIDSIESINKFVI